MKPITISLNPTYLCNFRCKFCYLTPEQLADKTKLDPKRLKEILEELRSAGYLFEHVDFYGGEIGLLSLDYLRELDEVLFDFNDDASINIVTNLYKVHPFFLEDHVTLSVSYDFEAREKSAEVLANILKTNKPISILMLASPKVLSKDVEEMIKFFNSIANVVSVEIKPYSSNQANQLFVTNIDFENFVYKWLTAKTKKNFSFINENNIKRSLLGEYNAFSDNHIYITPTGKIATLEFDENDNEFFLEFDKFEEYLKWTEQEKKKIFNNSFCNKCEYQGHCLTEHYRNVTSLEDSCNGYKRLLDESQLLFS